MKRSIIGVLIAAISAAFICAATAAPAAAFHHHRSHRPTRVGEDPPHEQSVFALLFGHQDGIGADFDVGTPFGGVGMEAGVYAPRGSVAAMIRARAEAVGVPVSIALAVGRYESGFRMGMRGRAGERGAMQVLPRTARRMGIYGNLYGEAGIEAGVRYLKYVMDAQGRYGTCAAISAYNHGEGYVSCTRYGRTVLALAGGARTIHAAMGARVWQASWQPADGPHWRHYRHHWHHAAWRHHRWHHRHRWSA